jgi:hypothetical protein
MEETEKPRYPKDICVGRIVIEEIPEEKEEVTKPDVVKRDEVRPRHEEKETRYESEKVTGTRVKEVIKVGRLDITDYEKIQKESKRVEQRKATYTEQLRKDRKVL